MSNILISIIVPAYNEEKLISSCISSLEKQDFNKENYEIIVVDNGSTDNTVKVVENFNVKLIYEPKKGISSAIRRGIFEAKGEIITITNADTVVFTDWISNIYKTFKSNPDIVVVSGRVIFNPKNFLSCVGELFMNYVGGIILKDIMGPNFAIRKDIYYKIGGLREDINFNCETELFLRVKKEGEAVFLWNNPVVTSNRHFRGIEAIKYCIRGAISSMSLLFFKRATFVDMVDVR